MRTAFGVRLLVLAFCGLVMGGLASGCGARSQPRARPKPQPRPSSPIRWVFAPAPEADLMMVGIWPCGDDIAVSWQVYFPATSAAAEDTWACYLGRLRADTGKPRWQLPTGNKQFCRVAIEDGEDLYAVIYGRQQGVWRVSARTGQVRWKSRLAEVGPFPPVADGERLYVIDSEGQDTIHAIGKERGRPIWHRKLPGRIGRLVAAQGRVYASVPGGPVLCMNAADGQTVWSNGEISDPGAPALAGDRLVVPGRERVYRLRVADGHTLWTYAARDNWIAARSTGPGGEAVFTTDVHRTVHALRISDGSPLWSWAPPSRPRCGLLASRRARMAT